MSMSSLNSIGETVFELESENENVDGQTQGQTDKKWTNERTELHQFRKEHSYDGDLSPSSLNSIGQTVFEFESGNGNFDGQTN